MSSEYTYATHYLTRALPCPATALPIRYFAKYPLKLVPWGEQVLAVRYREPILPELHGAAALSYLYYRSWHPLPKVQIDRDDGPGQTTKHLSPPLHLSPSNICSINEQLLQNKHTLDRSGRKLTLKERRACFVSRQMIETRSDVGVQWVLFSKVYDSASKIVESIRTMQRLVGDVERVTELIDCLDTVASTTQLQVRKHTHTHTHLSFLFFPIVRLNVIYRDRLQTVGQLTEQNCISISPWPDVAYNQAG
jgi:hypothetical protein